MDYSSRKIDDIRDEEEKILHITDVRRKSLTLVER